jgi:hypothetical protein
MVCKEGPWQLLQHQCLLYFHVNMENFFSLCISHVNYERSQPNLHMHRHTVEAEPLLQRAPKCQVLTLMVPLCNSKLGCCEVPILNVKQYMTS